MSEMIKVEADEPGLISLETRIPAASTSELEEKQDSKDLNEQQLLVVKEELLDLWSCSLDQKSPGPPQIKEEEEEVCIFQGGEQLTVKMEDEEKPNHLLIKVEDFREAEAPISDVKNNVSGDDETNLSGTKPENEERDCKWSETTTHQSGVNSDMGCKTAWKALSCPVCCKEFVRKQMLQKHLAFHSVEESNRCLAEKKKRAKDQKKRVVCEKCGRSVASPYYQQHLILHTGEKPFSCNECGKRYGSLVGLKAHLTIHTTERPFQCDECGKKFAFKAGLKIHMSVHSGEKPFACADCDRRFRTKGDLQGHMVTHTGLKPFICSFCGSGFTQRGSLVSHVRHHTGENMHVCDICDKRFVRKCHLERHIKTHSKEQKVNSRELKHHCDICRKKFLHRYRLTRHMLTHAEKKAFSCEVCFKRFSWLESLERHMKTYHNK